MENVVSNKKTIIWSGLIILAIFAFIIGIFLYLEDGLKKTMCTNQIHEEYISPDQAYKAVIFERNCGATTGYTTQISIISNDKDLDNNSANTYVAKGHPNKTSLTIKWIESNHLFVNNENSQKEYKKENNLYLNTSINISYKK